MTTAGSLPVPNNWINDRYGSKKGFARHSYFEFKRLIGQFDHLKVQRKCQPNRIVFVCVGNICRSPIAEIVAKSVGLESTSYGLNTSGGDSADCRAINFASITGFDLTNHATRPIEHYKHIEGDLIVGMEPKHILPLREKYCNAKITLLGLYSDRPSAYIHDPYNTNKTFFSYCETIVVSATMSLIEHVR
ncbi:hypothetical protein [Saccharospirillum impatiens]|uniref:arsenate reductase/protein-tyrosine-phosphatase family protein n=1 Tax=Saccharospirillum impatiens TaxID=169438 RepID=UPI00068444E8|nr:hypothetical protein [Saccharospirillum impatiens]